MNIHVVQPGDTLSSIAAIYGVSESKLLQDNELINPDLYQRKKLLSQTHILHMIG